MSVSGIALSRSRKLRSFIRCAWDQAADLDWAEGRRMWRRNFIDGVKETKDVLAGAATNFPRLTLLQKFNRVAFSVGLAGFAAYSFSSALGGFSVALLLTEGLGLAGFFTLKSTARLTYNKNRIAVDPAAAAMIMPQAFIHGGVGYGVMMGAKGVRTVLLSHIPEDREALRKAVGLATWGIGILTMGAISPRESLWEITPAISMTLGVASDMVSSSKTRYARFMHTVSDCLHVGYNVAFNSFSGTFGHVLNLQNLLMNGIAAHDLPRVDTNGAPIGYVSQWSHYAQRMIVGQETNVPVPVQNSAPSI